MVVVVALLCTPSIHSMERKPEPAGSGKGTKITQASRNLLEAAEDGNLRCVQAALNDGADSNTSDEYGWTPLHLAARNGYKDIVEILLRAGANIKIDDILTVGLLCMRLLLVVVKK